MTLLSHAVQFPKYQLQLRKRTSIWYASRAMSTTSTLTRSQTGAESERDEAAVDYVLDKKTGVVTTGDGNNRQQQGSVPASCV